jgi:hypothetical protein
VSGLSDADRATLLTPCVCGHDLNAHGSMAGCWTCPELEPPAECPVSFEALLSERLEAIVRARVTAALNDAAEAVEADYRNQNFAATPSTQFAAHVMGNAALRAAHIVRNRART